MRKKQALALVQQLKKSTTPRALDRLSLLLGAALEAKSVAKSLDHISTSTDAPGELFLVNTDPFHWEVLAKIVHQQLAIRKYGEKAFDRSTGAKKPKVFGIVPLDFATHSDQTVGNALLSQALSQLVGTQINIPLDAPMPKNVDSLAEFIA